MDITITLNQTQEVLKRLKNVAKQSNATKRKVGAFVCDLKRLYLPYDCIDGCNHNKINNVCENELNETFSHVIHAEADAIMKYYKSQYQFEIPVLFCTYSPCMHCCKLIAQSDIKAVYFVNKHKTNFHGNESGIKDDMSPYKFLISCGIDVYEYKEAIGLFMKIVPINTKPKPKRAVIYHSADADGWMSVYLLKLYNDIYVKDFDIDYVGWNYEREHEIFTPEFRCKYESFLFADVSPTIEWLNSLHEKQQVLIFDHHLNTINKIIDCHSEDVRRKNIEIFYSIGNLESACKIIWKEIFVKNNIDTKYGYLEDLVTIISDYDTWSFEKYVNTKQKRRCLDFAQYFKTYITCAEEFSDFMRITFNNTNDEIVKEKLNDIASIGNNLNDLIIQQNKTNIKNTNYIRFGIGEEINIFLISGYPNYFLMQQVLDTYEISNAIIVCYNLDYIKRKIKLAIRSKNTHIITANTIAEKLGGGGHTDASGVHLDMNENNFKIITHFYEFAEKLGQEIYHKEHGQYEQKQFNFTDK